MQITAKKTWNGMKTMKRMHERNVQIEQQAPPHYFSSAVVLLKEENMKKGRNRHAVALQRLDDTLRNSKRGATAADPKRPHASGHAEDDFHSVLRY